jgi:hypothetical protein
MRVNQLPDSYSEQYDHNTVASLAGLLGSIEDVVYMLNGVKADILSGTYTQGKARLDYQNILYLEGVDVFSALEEVANSPW